MYFSVSIWLNILNTYFTHRMFTVEMPHWGIEHHPEVPNGNPAVAGWWLVIHQRMFQPLVSGELNVRERDSTANVISKAGWISAPVDHVIFFRPRTNQLFKSIFLVGDLVLMSWWPGGARIFGHVLWLVLFLCLRKVQEPIFFRKKTHFDQGTDNSLLVDKNCLVVSETSCFH